MRSVSEARAVRKIIGTPARSGSRRMPLQMSRPSESGSMMSSRIRSGRTWRQSSMAPLPVCRPDRSGPEADILVGNAMPMKNMPAGTIVHNIELRPGKGAQMARSAGSQAQLVSKEGGSALLKLPSGEVRRVPLECMATVGQVGNVDHENVSLGKAGRTRWLGKRPHNLGVTMNPVDHPHGGGEGKTSGGRHPVTPWGQPTRGFKTRNNKRTDKWIVTRKSKKR